VHCCGAVQATGGLIQQDDGGVDQQLVADGDTLALTTADATPEEATCSSSPTDRSSTRLCDPQCTPTSNGYETVQMRSPLLMPRLKKPPARIR
jgi:hypothetical protein